ncbi:MAG: hypothetical protein PF489_01650, partial [Salinivirgaceae bacterium]|nr:hypothetical protein [Salinivirgaceae bacterium]
MTAKDWGGMAGSYKRWATGYEKYRNAARNRISDYFQIYIGQPDGLEVLKHWLAHHNEGSEAGGVATIVTSMNNFSLCDQLPPQSDDAGAWVLTDMEVLPSGISSHEMAVVGYNDAIKYDFNGDGLFTNDRDINNDDVVDMKDWEVGALIVANSLGADWMNDGFIYWPYSLIGGGSSEGNPIDLQAAYCVNLPKIYEPSLFFDVKLRFSDRRKVELHLGRSISGSETIGVPQYYTTISFLDSGSLPMNGVSDEPIEMSFELFEARENAFARNLVIGVTSRANTVGSGEFISYRIYDNDIGETIADEQVNDPVEHNIYFSFFNSRYHYISPVISEELSLWSSVDINKPVTVQGGARLRIYTDTLAFENQGKIMVEDSGTILFNRASDVRSSGSGQGFLLDGRMVINENLVYNLPPDMVIEGGASGGVVDIFGALLLGSQQVQNIEMKVHSSGKIVVKDAVEFGHNSKLTVEGLVHVRHGGYLSLVGNSQLCGDSIEGSILVDGTLLLTNTQLRRLNIVVSGTGKVFVAGNAVFKKSTQLHLRSNSIVQGANNNARVVFGGKVQIEPNTQFIDLTNNNSGGVEFRTDEMVKLDQIQFQNSNVYVAVDY